LQVSSLLLVNPSPMAKNVIPKGLALKMSNQKT
jgi:hypothetical protein